MLGDVFALLGETKQLDLKFSAALFSHLTQ